jgi:hypothetical protein
MLHNMGSADRTIRIVFALLIAILFFTDQISGIAAIILGLFSIIFLLTGLVGFCPLYFPFKISTIKKPDKN